VRNLVFFLGGGARQPAVGQGFLIQKVSNHTQQRTTLSKTPQVKWSARRTDLYLTTHSNHNRQTSILPVGL